ncbi:uncharacterized protein LOC131023452 [Salvia miltiorrhiza]|uniref:uncharacterized protein LOC131023452 n=1 Tax=Salvia miltiorrhiza TaxID=226208 RepID=UPI0025ACAC96|nr:uncharacterized protein LOC131023452 [Salvia miltiorrhiza]
MWRAVQNLLASDLNLHHRHISSSGICSWCHKDWGSTVHCLIFCDVTRGAWKKTKWWLVVKNKKHFLLEDICRAVIESSDREGFDLFCVSLWWTWSWLCKAKHDCDFKKDLELVVGCADFLCSFHEARRTFLTKDRLLPNVGDNSWIPPPAGLFRLDTDVSIQGNGEATGAGFLVRDHRGKIIAAAAHRVGRTETVLMGELHAMLLGIGFCLENQIGPLLVFTDSLLAVHVVHEDSAGSESLCDELFEVFSHARHHLVLDFRHARREANRAAHCLANFAATSSGVMIWKSSFPTWLSDIASRDLI